MWEPCNNWQTSQMKKKCSVSNHSENQFLPELNPLLMINLNTIYTIYYTAPLNMLRLVHKSQSNTWQKKTMYIILQFITYCSSSLIHSLPRCVQNRGPNFRNFLGRSLEDFFSKESMQIFETSLENVFGRIWEDLPKKILRKGAQFSKLLWKLLRKNLGKYIGKH